MAIKVGSSDMKHIILGAGSSDMRIYVGSEQIWPDISHNYIHLLATASQTVSFNASSTTPTLQYSYDKTTWTDWNYSALTFGVSGKYGVFFRGVGNTTINDSTYANHFVLGNSGSSVILSGNVMTLLDYTNPSSSITSSYCFAALFSGCTAISSVGTAFLPATALTSYCYAQMFAGTSIKKCPNLNAATVGDNSYASMFNGCTSLVSACTLPAKTVGNGGYNSMFLNCTSLVTPPTLSAVTATTNWAFNSMFNGCTKLETAAAMPSSAVSACTKRMCTYMYQNCYSLKSAATLNFSTINGVSGCAYMFANCSSLTYSPNITASAITGVAGCQYMFSGCKSLKKGPALGVVSAGTRSLQCMFSGCTSLVTAATMTGLTYVGEYACNAMYYSCTTLTVAPKLTPTKIYGKGPYYNMFAYCTSLATAPDLPVTDFSGYTQAYYQMFYGCTSLQHSPVLCAATLTQQCYYQMFRGCSKLTGITCLATSISASACTSNWVNGVSGSGEFRGIEATPWPTGATNGIPVGWGAWWQKPSWGSYSGLTFASASKNSISWDNATNPVLWLSRDKEFFHLWGDDNYTSAYTFGTTSSASSAITLYGFNSTLNTSSDKNYVRFSSTSAAVTMSGSVCGLLSASAVTETIPVYTFAEMFSNADGLTDCSNAMIYCTGNMSAYSCYHMFADNTTITKAPSVKVKNIRAFGCTEMFTGCTKLTTSCPTFSANTILSSGCMGTYKGCTALTGGTSTLAAKTVYHYSCYQMYNGCTALKATPAFNATTVYTYSFLGMFQGCTTISASTIPPATSVSDFTYADMYNGCTGLKSAPILPATTLGMYCYASMFQGCVKLSSIYLDMLPATTLTNGCYLSMFQNCTAMTTAPALPATTLVDSCYNYMFDGCSSLNDVRCASHMNPTTTVLDDYSYEWLSGVASSGTLRRWTLPYSTSTTCCPSGWTQVQFYS